MSPTNLYYILTKLEHSNFIIFLNIVDFVFLTTLQLLFKPIFDFWDLLELSHDFRRAYIWLYYLLPTYIRYWWSWRILTSLFSSILAIICFWPLFSCILSPFLTLQMSWSLVNTSEGHIFYCFYLLPTYITYWRSWSTLTSLFSSILSILCFWPLFSFILSPFLTFEMSWI